MKSKIKNIMASVFEVSVDDINDESSPDTIENWDSLRHMNLITVLEEEFDIRFNDEQITEMMNFNLIIYTVNEVLGTK
jgi:acyl carrier protein